MHMGIYNDQLKRRDNAEAGHTLCRRCEGTGNELFAMYRKCSACGGTGVAEYAVEQLERGWQSAMSDLERVLRERNEARARVAELERRCEQAAKITTDPHVYELLDDAGWKAERACEGASDAD